MIRLLAAITVMVGSVLGLATQPSLAQMTKSSSAQVMKSPYSDSDTFCLDLESEALTVVRWHRDGKNFNEVEQDLRNRIVSNPDDLAKELKVARSVWDDHHTSYLDIPSEVEAACRKANGLAALPPPPPPHTYLPCSFYARVAYGYAHERNLGYSMKSRIDGLPTDPHDDQVIVGMARKMIQNLWARPLITPQEAYAMALQSCGWPRLPG